MQIIRQTISDLIKANGKLAVLGESIYDANETSTVATISISSLNGFCSYRFKSPVIIRIFIGMTPLRGAREEEVNIQ